jgi:hypothetical protein
VVEVDKRGRRFHALVLSLQPDEGLELRPLGRGISFRHATAREVVDHWSHARPWERGHGDEPPAPGEPGEQLGLL